MFYVEHMKKLFFNLFFLIFYTFVLSCNKKDPTPELSDPIYTDLSSELSIAQKNLEAEKSQCAKMKSELEQATPQTGQNKYAAKRYYESVNNLDGYKQQVKYFEIALELRKNEARARYQESLLNGGRPWIDPKEIEDYHVRLKLQKAKLTWGKKPSPAEKPIDKKDVPRGTPAEHDADKKSEPIH